MVYAVGRGMFLALFRGQLLCTGSPRLCLRAHRPDERDAPASGVQPLQRLPTSKLSVREWPTSGGEAQVGAKTRSSPWWCSWRHPSVYLLIC